MVDGLEPAEKVEVVPTPDSDPIEGIQTQLRNLEGMILVIQADDQGIEFLRQELRDATQLLKAAIDAYQNIETKVQHLIHDVGVLVDVVEVLERKCQGLADRPLARNCQSCGAKLDARTASCPTCGAHTP